MDKLATILNVDEEKLTKEIGVINIGKNMYPLINEHFKNDFDKFKRFYLFCNKCIPTVFYQFTETYKQFERNIIQNDIPFVSKEEEKEILALVKESNNSIIDSLKEIQKMIIEISNQHIELDTSDIVSAYDNETKLLQTIFIDLNNKIEKIEANQRIDTDINKEENKHNLNSNKEKVISFIKTNYKYIVFIILIFIAFELGGMFL